MWSNFTHWDSYSCATNQKVVSVLESNVTSVMINILVPWSQRFSFAAKREERERSGKRKPLVAGHANLTIMLP